jgi:hypothetical protein
MNICDEYSPRNKHDFEKVSKLKKIERTELFSLMGCVQDMNWLIAMEVAELLLMLPKEIFHLLKMF